MYASRPRDWRAGGMDKWMKKRRRREDEEKKKRKEREAKENYKTGAVNEGKSSEQRTGHGMAVNPHSITLAL